ncbi:polyprotein [Bienertia sinuspersici]
MKNTICYKCHGQVHMARDCKTNMFISLREHYALINQKLAEKEQSKSSDDSDNMEVLNDPKAWDNLPMYGLEGDDGECLILRRMKFLIVLLTRKKGVIKY